MPTEGPLIPTSLFSQCYHIWQLPLGRKLDPDRHVGVRHVENHTTELPLSSEMPWEALADTERILWASQLSHYSSSEGLLITFGVVVMSWIVVKSPSIMSAVMDDFAWIAKKLVVQEPLIIISS